MVQQDYFLLSSKILDPSAKSFFSCIYLKLNLEYLLSNLFSEHFLSLYHCRADTASTSSFRRESLMASSRRFDPLSVSLKLAAQTPCNKRLKNSLSTLIVTRRSVRFVRMLGHSPMSNRMSATPAFVPYSAVPYTL